MAELDKWRGGKPLQRELWQRRSTASTSAGAGYPAATKAASTYARQAGCWVLPKLRVARRLIKSHSTIKAVHRISYPSSSTAHPSSSTAHPSSSTAYPSSSTAYPSSSTAQVQPKLPSRPSTASATYEGPRWPRVSVATHTHLYVSTVPPGTYATCDTCDT